MKKSTRRILLLIAIPLAVLSAAIAAGVMLNRPVDAITETPLPKYILSSYNGMVAVFVPEDDAPTYVTQTPVSCLPSSDRKVIKEGLPIYTEEELTRLLEDYGT